ncbi:hypothetical protein L7F22_033080 [Adiantum nelumboides]|nr:hypothetical protein [Adiantum nelumboides]
MCFIGAFFDTDLVLFHQNMEKECLEGVSQWNGKEVSQFVKGYLGSDRYTRTILKNNINGSSLLHMSIPSWEALGVDIIGHRVALHSWVKDKLSTSTNHLPQEKHVSNNEKVSSSTLSLQDEVSPIQSELANKQQLPLSHPLPPILIPRNAREKTFLRKNYTWEHNRYNKNLECIRRWAENRLGLFPIEKFLNADLTKDKEMREQIEDFIRRKRKTLLSFGGIGDKDGEYMSVKVIFQKLNQHRRYLRFKAMPLSHGKSKRCPSLSIDLEDFENQTQDSLDSMEAPKALMDNHKEYQESVSPPRNVPTMADDCYVLAGFHEMVSIMGSPQILSNENINCRYGLFLEGMQQQFVYIPFLDGDTKEVGIGTIFSKSYGGNTYAKWKGQVIEVPVVYLKTLESKSTSELLLSKEESPSSSLQQRSSVQSTTEGAKESYEALLENSWDDYPLSENLLIDLDHSNEAVKESTWKMFDMVETSEEPGVLIIENFVRNQALGDLDGKSDIETSGGDDDATSPIAISKKKPKIMGLNELICGNKEKGNEPSKKKALKNITNKKSSNDDVVNISRSGRRESGSAKRATKVYKSKKRNLNPSHGTVTLSTHVLLVTSLHFLQDRTLKKTTKEAIALKLMGEHNIDFMYRRLDSYLKELQRTTPKGSFDFKKECEDSEALDVLVSWALGQNKIKLKDTNGKDIGQEEVELL